MADLSTRLNSSLEARTIYDVAIYRVWRETDEDLYDTISFTTYRDAVAQAKRITNLKGEYLPGIKVARCEIQKRVDYMDTTGGIVDSDFAWYETYRSGKKECRYTM